MTGNAPNPNRLYDELKIGPNRILENADAAENVIKSQIEPIIEKMAADLAEFGITSMTAIFRRRGKGEVALTYTISYQGGKLGWRGENATYLADQQLLKGGNL